MEDKYRWDKSLKKPDGGMIGRAAYHTPYLLACERTF